MHIPNGRHVTERSYFFLSESEKDMDRNTATETLKLMVGLGYTFLRVTQKANRYVLKRADTVMDRRFGQSENVQVHTVQRLTSINSKVNKMARAFKARQARRAGPSIGRASVASSASGDGGGGGGGGGDDDDGAESKTAHDAAHATVPAVSGRAARAGSRSMDRVVELARGPPPPPPADDARAPPAGAAPVVSFGPAVVYVASDARASHVPTAAEVGAPPPPPLPRPPPPPPLDLLASPVGELNGRSLATGGRAMRESVLPVRRRSVSPGRVEGPAPRTLHGLARAASVSGERAAPGGDGHVGARRGGVVGDIGYRPASAALSSTAGLAHGAMLALPCEAGAAEPDSW